MEAIAWQDSTAWQGGGHLVVLQLPRCSSPELRLSLVPSAVRGAPDVAQRNHPVPGLAGLLQGLAELRLGHRGPAGIPHQDHV